jgi:hypothetical protein
VGLSTNDVALLLENGLFPLWWSGFQGKGVSHCFVPFMDAVGLLEFYSGRRIFAMEEGLLP